MRTLSYDEIVAALQQQIEMVAMQANKITNLNTIIQSQANQLAAFTANDKIEKEELEVYLNKIETALEAKDREATETALDHVGTVIGLMGATAKACDGLAVLKGRIESLEEENKELWTKNHFTRTLKRSNSF
jgi:hypothetical protein